MMCKARPQRAQITAGLRIALWAEYLLRPFAKTLLRRRLARGKEDPTRWQEKLGLGQAERPNAPLIWLHGVGLGEVLALRGLVAEFSAQRSDLRFLLTYSTKAAGHTIARNLPEGCQHQFLPVDLPGIADRFVAHWQPDLAVWTDQEIWPRLAWLVHRRGIPQAIIACRISQASCDKRQRLGSFYRGLYSLPDVIEAQDEVTAAALLRLSGREAPVTGSLKPAAAELSAAPNHAQIVAALADRDVWVLASSHPRDEDIAISAHRQHIRKHPRALLIIAPRDPNRGAEIVNRAIAKGMTACQREEFPSANTNIWVADSVGELGSWYRIAHASLIGGTFDDTEGHNPWEAAASGTAIIFGPRTANFAADFEQLERAGAAKRVTTAEALVDALQNGDSDRMVKAARAERTQAAKAVRGMVHRLIALMEQK